MFEFFITIVIAAVVLSFVSKKIIAVVCKAMGWDNPFVSVKELMRQGHSFPEAMAISHAKRSEFELKGFIYGASKFLPFGRRNYVSSEEYFPNEQVRQQYMMQREQEEADQAYWNAMANEANKEAKAQEMVDDYGGQLSDYL